MHSHPPLCVGVALLVASLIGCGDVAHAAASFTFVEGSQPLGGTGSYGGLQSSDVAVADLDRDGATDVVIAHWTGSSQIWINQGNGTFVATEQEIDNATRVALADLDGDEFPDAFFLNNDIAAIANRVWFNDTPAAGGAVSFTRSSQDFGASFSMGVALGQLDGAAGPDAFVTRTLDNPDRIWLNNGLGQFSDAGLQLGGSESGSAVALGDLDVDGDLDVFVTNNGPDRIWINQGGGDFGGGAMLGDNLSLAVALGDLDGDDDLDAVVAELGINRVWINQGGAQEGDPGEFLAGSGFGESVANDVALGDFDGDGDLDVFLARSDTNRVYENDGTGVFTDTGLTLGTATSQAVALADFDNDGRLDAIVANDGEPDKVWFNRAAGPPMPLPGTLFDSGQALGEDFTIAVVLGDLDKDGDLDAVTVGEDQNPDNPADDPNRIWINQGGIQGDREGDFADSMVRLGTDAARALALSDIDLDNDLDIVVGSDGGSTVWINQGGAQAGIVGQFVLRPPRLSPAERVSSVVLVDLDNDGDPDAVEGYPDFPTNIYRNLGGLQGGTIGEFDEEPVTLFDEIQVAAGSRELDAIDLSGDGYADLLHLTADGNLVLWRNPTSLADVPWTKLPTVDVGLPLLGDGFAVATIDRDELTDVAVFDNGSYRVGLNNGQAPSTENGPFDSLEGLGLVGGLPLQAIRFGLLNDDEDPDLVIAGGRRGEVRFGRGDGTFALAQSLFGKGQNDVALGDLDGDGDTDAWIARAGSDMIWLNDEADVLPALTFATPPVRRPFGPPRLDWWEQSNASVYLRLNRPHAEPIDIRVTANSESDVGVLPGAVRELTLPAGETQLALEAYVDQPGGNEGEIWNPYFSTDFISATEEGYIIQVEVLTAGVTFVGSSNVEIFFHHPALEARRCFLVGVVSLLELLTGQFEAISANALHPAPQRASGKTAPPEAVVAQAINLDLDLVRRLRDDVLLPSPSGKYYTHLYETISAELLQTASQNPWLWWQAYHTLVLWMPAIEAVVNGNGNDVEITSAMTEQARDFLASLQAAAGDEFVALLDREIAALDPDSWTGLTAAELLARAEARPLDSPARLLNLSTRAAAQTGDNVVIPGFVIRGTATKRLLIRAVGPRLADLGVTGVLPDPRMVVKRLVGGSYVDLASNDDWGTNANLAEIVATSKDVGAFALADGSRDAALLLDLEPGQYTVIADGVNNATGNALVELYDASDPAANARLINISTRGFAGVGDAIIIPGFVISSEGLKTVLLRVVGPSLADAPFNVSGTMADPKLTLYRHHADGSQSVLLENDNWGDAVDPAYTAQIADQVGAFPLPDGSTDAAVVVTLQPGIYTVHGSSVDGTGTGVVLVEVYLVE